MAPQRTATPAQLATYLLACVDRVQVSADDNTLAYTQAARSLLHGIVDGSLTVAQTAAPEPVGNAMPNVNGADGVIPASVSGAPQT